MGNLWLGVALILVLLSGVLFYLWRKQVKKTQRYKRSLESVMTKKKK